MAKKDQGKTVQNVLCVIVGLGLMAGALVAWHQFHIDGFIAWMVAAAGAAAIGKGLDVNLGM